MILALGSMLYILTMLVERSPLIIDRYIFLWIVSSINSSTDWNKESNDHEKVKNNSISYKIMNTKKTCKWLKSLQVLLTTSFLITKLQGKKCTQTFSQWTYYKVYQFLLQIFGMKCEMSLKIQTLLIYIYRIKDQFLVCDPTI